MKLSKSISPFIHKRWPVIVPFIILFVAMGYLYSERYLFCFTKDISMCLQSKKYNSVSGEFIFRYPKDYPMSFKSGSEMVNQYNFDDEYVEWVNFSEEWYPNAGGERLGDVIVKKKTDFNSVKEYGDKRLSDFNSLPEQYKGTPPKIEYIKVGGEDAARISLEQQPSSFNPPSDNYVIIHNGHLYTISFDYNDYYHKLPIEYYNKAKEVILSTFSFN